MKLVRILLLLINFIIIVYCIPYLLRIIEGKRSYEGYDLPLSMVVLDLFLLMLLVFTLIKKYKWETNIIAFMIGIYTISSLLGTNLSPILGIVLPLIGSLIIFKSLNKGHKQF